MKAIETDGIYRVACHGCGQVCRTLPEGLDGSGLPSLWFCRCNRPGRPEEALLLCDACHEKHECPEAT